MSNHIAPNTATNADFDRAFDQLLSSWTSHQNLRSAGSSTSDLWASRSNLDNQRLTTSKTRTALLASC